MTDTVLEILEEEMGKAFKQFAARPTQSGRIQLRHDLLVIAGAMDVEANNLPENEAEMLRSATAELRNLGELALIAPKESLITKADAPPPTQKAPVKPKKKNGALSAMFRDAVRLLKKL